jgi:hypothetical protein
VDAAIVYPSNDWQTLTFSAGRQFVGNASNAVGAVAGPGPYAANDSVAIRVYAYRTVPENSIQIFSRVPAQSAAVTSNDVFAVNWTWDAVPGAEGYRLLRNYNSGGYNDYVDVIGATSYNDNAPVWQSGNTVTPSFTQLGSSIQWNPSVGNPNNIATPWGTLESINFAISDTNNTGPFDVFIDNIQNGSTVFQTFEEAVAGRSDYGFLRHDQRQHSFRPECRPGFECRRRHWHEILPRSVSMEWPDDDEVAASDDLRSRQSSGQSGRSDFVPLAVVACGFDACRAGASEPVHQPGRPKHGFELDRRA